MPYELVVIGASWGGLDAVGRLLSALPDDFPVPIAIAQHRGPDSDDGALERTLSRRAGRPVQEVEDKDPILRGGVYVAPAQYHLLIEKAAFALSVEARVQYSRPSIDVLFESAAEAYRDELIGIVLTGANRDGAAGLARVKQRGGCAVVEDPATATNSAMPAAAIAATPVDRVLSLGDIAPFLVGLHQRQDELVRRASR